MATVYLLVRWLKTHCCSLAVLRKNLIIIGSLIHDHILHSEQVCVCVTNHGDLMIKPGSFLIRKRKTLGSWLWEFRHIIKTDHDLFGKNKWTKYLINMPYAKPKHVQISVTYGIFFFPVVLFYLRQGLPS